MTRYLPARQYLGFAISAVVLAALVTWFAFALHVNLAYIPAGLFGLSAALLFALAFRPAVEIHEGYLSIGKRIVPWMDIRRLDRTGWISPLLILRITLFDDSRLLLIYPGRPGFLQQPAAASAPPLARCPHRRRPLPAVLGRSAGPGQRRAQADSHASLPHSPPRG